MKTTHNIIPTSDPFMSDKPWETLASAESTNVLVEMINGDVVFGKLQKTDLMFNIELEDCIIIDIQQ